MNMLRRLRAWWQPSAPKTPEELEARRVQREANFDQESRRAPGKERMMEVDAERHRRR
jgi:hypothetical protein